MEFEIRFQNTIHYCGWERAEIQKIVNVCIAPLLRGYSKHKFENHTWRYGKNTVVLANGEKTSFYVNGIDNRLRSKEAEPTPAELAYIATRILQESTEYSDRQNTNNGKGKKGTN